MRIVHRWTQEEIDYLREIAYGKHLSEIVDMMSEKFNMSFSPNQIKGIMGRQSIKTGFTGRFEKGMNAWNKGTKGLTGPNKTSFKKGNEPWNKKKIGSERIDINGYILIKVKEPNAWRLKHRIMYEEYHNVKLTSVDAVIFADQNKLNLEKDNLILISKSQLLKMNNEKLIFNNKELTKTGANIAELMMKVDERK